MEVLMLATCLVATLAAQTSPGSTERRLSPDELGLKPDPTEGFIFPQIPEPEGRQFDPRPQDLNVTVLRARLGRHFDSQFMSISRPRSNRTHMDFPFRQHKGRLVPVPGAEMPAFLRRMNFKSVRLPDGSRLKTRVSAKLQRKLQLFLWAYTACPVLHSWRDLGPRYWPRYVRRGTCKGSCSVPPGMQCAPSQRALKVILRWQCHEPNHCQWIELKNFPIVTGCACTCKAPS
ncbi:noggin [Anabrus simplex]|uniref:noggin n=1 Tax=Anabrus simplex TaxID=316456 RepID=UPI0034DD7389